jgi:gamma-glutamyltranspeptidase/glutathione hydrolase
MRIGISAFVRAPSAIGIALAGVFARMKHVRTNARALALGARIGFVLLVGGAWAGDPAWMARSQTGMVAADHPEASQIGAEVLKSGGNAFDAAIATSLALTVCRPESTGIGGGGFLVAYVAKERRFVALDFREMAPASATSERYAKLNAEKGDGPSPSIYGGNAVGVPGLVAGLDEIHKRFATREWAALVWPAAELALRGFEVDQECRDSCASAMEDIERYRGFRERFSGLARRIAPGGKIREIGARFERPDIAATLRILSERGSSAFYAEPIGAAIVRAVNDSGGAMTLDDLKNYRVREREPLRFRSSVGGRSVDFDWICLPPPSSGGVTLAQVVQAESIWNTWKCLGSSSNGDGREDYSSLGAFRTAELIETYKHAFANRARYLGDPESSRIPVSQLVSREYAAEIAHRVSSAIVASRPSTDEYGIAPTPASQGGAMPPDDRGTSHFCVADRFGNVVAMTETVNGGFGSFVVVEPFGIILNNQMDDFTTVEGEANLFGLVQGKANLVAPGKRPLSSMSPTIVMQDGKPVLAIGASGGPRIITAVLQVALHALNGVPLADAMVELRLHHQWKPDEIYLDREPDEKWAAILKHLQAAGYKISGKRHWAAVQAIQFLPDGQMVGACDPKKGGRPAGPR